jgi:hypothetical protein
MPLTEAGPVVQLQISLSRVPLRIAPAWSVLAGAIAVASMSGGTGLWIRIVAAVILGDLAWGILRQYAQAGDVGDRQPVAFALPLPYAQPEAPLSRLLGGLTSGGATWHGAAAGLFLALGGALLLGWPAVALSFAAILITALAASLARRGDFPASAYACLDVLLPWTLGMVAAGWTARGETRWAPLAVAAALTALQWGALRATNRQSGDAPTALVFGALAVTASLVAFWMPGAAALAAVLMAPALYWLGQGRRRDASVGSRSGWSGPWLLLTMMVVAVALR